MSGPFSTATDMPPRHVSSFPVSLAPSQLGRSVGAELQAPLSTQSASNRGAYRQCNTSAEKVKALDMGAVVVVLVQRDGYSHTKAAELAEEYVIPANIAAKAVEEG